MIRMTMLTMLTMLRMTMKALCPLGACLLQVSFTENNGRKVRDYLRLVST